VSYDPNDSIFEEARRLPTVELLDLIVRLCSYLDTVGGVKENLQRDREEQGEPTCGEILVLIDRWITMADELPADPKQVLIDLTNCIERKGPYAR